MRETSESALRLGAEALKALGETPEVIDETLAEVR